MAPKLSSMFLFILLAFSMTVGQALQYGTADNDTIVLSKLTLEDLFGTRNLDKRMFTRIKDKLGPKKPPIISKKAADHPPPPHEPISVQLKKTGTDYWYIEVPVDRRPNFKFEIDTYGVCSSVPFARNPFLLEQPESHFIACPRRPETTGIFGRPCQSRIMIDSVFSEGLLVMENIDKRRGILGWTLSNPRFEHMHFLPPFLSKFQSPIFAMYYSYQAEDASRVDIGVADESTFEIEYHKVVKVEGHQPWAIGAPRIFMGDDEIESQPTMIKVESKMVQKPIKTAYDSTLRCIYGPPAEVGKIRESIIERKNTNVFFQWKEGGIKWPVRPKYPGMYVQGEHEHYWDWYVGLFKERNPDSVDWVFGTEFGFGKYLVFKGGQHPEMGIGYQRTEQGALSAPPLEWPDRSERNQRYRRPPSAGPDIPPPY